MDKGTIGTQRMMKNGIVKIPVTVALFGAAIDRFTPTQLANLGIGADGQGLLHATTEKFDAGVLPFINNRKLVSLRAATVAGDLIGIDANVQSLPATAAFVKGVDIVGNWLRQQNRRQTQTREVVCAWPGSTYAHVLNRTTGKFEAVTVNNAPACALRFRQMDNRIDAFVASQGGIYYQGFAADGIATLGDKWAKIHATNRKILTVSKLGEAGLLDIIFADGGHEMLDVSSVTPQNAKATIYQAYTCEGVNGVLSFLNAQNGKKDAYITRSATPDKQGFQRFTAISASSLPGYLTQAFARERTARTAVRT
jgi:hypothetical protein